MKYYWLSYTCLDGNPQRNLSSLSNAVTNEHPFQYITDRRDKWNYYIIVSWKEITKEEFDLYKELDL